MIPTLLFVITADPRSSPRPAEAIRIAAGVGAWRTAEILLYLREAAVLALSEHPEGLVDEENYRFYFPGLRDFGFIYVQRAAPLLSNIGQTPYRYQEIDDAQLAGLAARSTYLLHF